MASQEIIPLENLLKPISEENPAGDDIRMDTSPSSVYYAIKDARNGARAAERNNMFDGNNAEADDQWRKILEIAPEILQKHAKDLEIASWYTEALVRRYGFQGLREGFSLIHGLIQQYWDNLYPLPDEDGVETRVASLTGLNGEGAEGVLIAPLRNVPLTQGSDPGPFSYWNYQQALEIEKIIDEESKADKAAKLGFSVDDIERAVTESSESFYLNLRDDVSRALEIYLATGQLLDEYCGIEDSPSISNITRVLQECLGTINHIGKYKMPSDSNEDETQDEAKMSGDEPLLENSSLQLSSGAVRNREEAFKKLTEISAFFRKTEPHSPISYILERAVKWGDMPLESLIRELIPDSSAREVYGSLTGVKTEEDY